MISQFLPHAVRRLVVFPKSIDPRWGPQRLRDTCERELGIRLDTSTAVLFYNRAQDTLILYALDADGDRCTTKKLERGVFLLPVPPVGEKYAVVDASKTDALFRS